MGGRRTVTAITNPGEFGLDTIAPGPYVAAFRFRRQVRVASGPLG